MTWLMESPVTRMLPVRSPFRLSQFFFPPVFRHGTPTSVETELYYLSIYPSPSFFKFRLACRCNRSPVTQTRLRFYYLSTFDRSANALFRRVLVARLSVSDLVCMTDLRLWGGRHPKRSYLSQAACFCENVQWNQEQITQKLVFSFGYIFETFPEKKKCSCIS